MENKKNNNENMPKPQSMKKKNTLNTLLAITVLVLYALGMIFNDSFGIIFLLLEIPLAIVMIVINIKNRPRK